MHVLIHQHIHECINQKDCPVQEILFLLMNLAKLQNRHLDYNDSVKSYLEFF